MVEGVLQGTDGTPIAGSQVRAVADAGRGGEGDAAESYSFDSVDGMPMGGERAVATTAADGTFRVESVKPGTVALLAEGKIHRPVRQAGINVLPAQHVKGVRLVADLGAVARVKVRQGPVSRPSPAKLAAPSILKPVPFELGESLREIGDPELFAVLESLAKSLAKDGE